MFNKSNNTRAMVYENQEQNSPGLPWAQHLSAAPDRDGQSSPLSPPSLAPNSSDSKSKRVRGPQPQPRLWRTTVFEKARVSHPSADPTVQTPLVPENVSICPCLEPCGSPFLE